MLYGAYGFTGRLLLAEAVRRGHRPVLAGRNAAKLAALATQYDLDWLALDLDYAERLNKTIERFTLVFHAWADDATRAHWLPDAAITIRKATPPKSLRLTWADGTSVEVGLADKGDRTAVSVQHTKLPDAAAAERMKAYWAEALGRLAALW